MAPVPGDGATNSQKGVALIYLDNNATTRPSPEVLEAMLPFFRDHFGNASSAHALGRMPEGALVQARRQVAELLHCQPAEVVFNSGGTEGINHAFRGVLEAFPAKRHFLTTAVEHGAVQAVAAWLKTQGAEVTFLGVDAEGRLDLERLAAAIRKDTALVSIMAANNETGVLFPLREIAAVVKAQGTLLHVDAVQAAGRIPLDVVALGADLLNISAHKFHGPKGAGALYIRRGLRLKPLLAGGQQERGRRGGTENVPALVGMGMAAQLAGEHLADWPRIARLRDLLETSLRGSIPGVRVNGQGAPRLANTALLSFKDVEGEALLLRLNERGVCVSTGSACTTGQKEPSHVLRAMAVPAEYSRGTLRFSLSRESTADEIGRVVEILPGLVADLRDQGFQAAVME
jgi:cysteine desulfurase